MIKLGSTTKSFVKNTIGMYNGQGRMYNMDRVSYLIGYAEVNQQATTAFSRIRVNKGWFFCDPSQVTEGDLVEDKTDLKKYLVMALKNEVLNGESVYLDATLYLCDTTATVTRWVDGARDVFGQVVDPTPQVVVSDIYIMTNPQNYDVLEQDDRQIAHDKVRIYLQAKHGVKVADRITTANGESYRVLRIDKVSLPNIWTCYVDVDER